MDNTFEFQLHVARLVLTAIDDHGFALAGSGAIRSHGIIDRATQDIDAFRPYNHPTEFSHAVEAAITALERAGLQVEVTREFHEFAQLSINDPTTGSHTALDLGIDWRSTPPTIVDGITTLSLRDAVMSKVHAVYSRAYPRDFLDLHAIRNSGLFTDEELLEGLHERENFVSTESFVAQLRLARRLELEHLQEYGITQEMLTQIVEHTLEWARHLDKATQPPQGFISGLHGVPNADAETISARAAQRPPSSGQSHKRGPSR